MLLNAVVYPLTIIAGTWFRVTGAVGRVHLSAGDLAWRAGEVTLCVIIVTAARQVGLHGAKRALQFNSPSSSALIWIAR